METGDVEKAKSGYPAPRRLSVVVPFHRNLGQLRQCLDAVRRAGRALTGPAELAELIVVADGAQDDPRQVVREAGGRLLAIEGPRGPAVARNRGVDIASGDLVVFVDTDVIAGEQAFERMVQALAAEPSASAVFGAYDEDPADPAFLSQCRNLGHCFVHQRSSREAVTFWAGLGAIRRDAFQAVGGYDERFRRPSVEDIDLGYRINQAGYRIILDPTIQGKHLKRWTFRSSMIMDVRDRGIPWTQLMHRYGGMRNDLNVTFKYRACVVVAYLLVACLVGAWWWPVLLAGVAVALVILWFLDLSFYRFFATRRSLGFALAWFPFHVLHHLTNGVSFALGTSIWLGQRLGLNLPGAVPSGPWARPRQADLPSAGGH
ncbi:MAG: glycosyltransferase [Vicinamibacterales bacterium]